MKKYNHYFVAGVAYIMFVTGMAASLVGKVLQDNHDPVSWYLPLCIFTMMFFPFMLGRLSNKD